MENSYIKYNSIAKTIYRIFNWTACIFSIPILLWSLVSQLIFMGTADTFYVWVLILLYLFQVVILFVFYAVQTLLLEKSDRNKSTATAIVSGLIGMLALLSIFFVGVVHSIGIVQLSSQEKKIRECPVQKVINRMPTIVQVDEETGKPIYPKRNSEYYVDKNGNRKEISDYNMLWVEKNCQVPEGDVY